MRKSHVAGAVGLLLSLCVGSPVGAQGRPSNAIPIKRVRLYESGVAYLERTGTIPSAAGLSLPLGGAQLDDALKTLVVMTDGATVTVNGIEFGSSVSRQMARALAGLKSDSEDDEVTYRSILETMKGHPVRIRMKKGPVVEGRLVELSAPPNAEGGEGSNCQAKSLRVGKGGDLNVTCAPTGMSLTVLTRTAELRRISVADLTAIQPTSKAWSDRFGIALDVLNEGDAKRERGVRVMGTVGKAITLGYVTEAPVWRTTYRLVTDVTGKSELHGWALIHNDTDEAWSKVQVELVNGRPRSFLFPLAAPRYARRELEVPNRELSTVPQLLGRTVDNMWNGKGALRTYRVSSPRVRMGATRVTRGFGAGHVAPTTLSSGLLALGDLAATDGATGAESGALFQYRMKKPIDLRARGTALLPFVRERVRVQPVVISSFDLALTGAFLTNTTRQTLPSGTMSLFEAGGFSGEARFARTKPGESRLVAYGQELDVLVSAVAHQPEELVKFLEYDFEHEDIKVHYVRRTMVTVDIENRRSTKRVVFRELDGFDNNSKINGAKIVHESLTGKTFARLSVPGRSEVVRRLVVREGLRRKVSTRTMRRSELRKWLASPYLHKKQLAVLEDALKNLKSQGRLGREAAALMRQHHAQSITLERARLNARALRGNAAAFERASKKVLSTDRGLHEVNRRRAKNRRKHGARRRSFRALLRRLNQVPPPKS